MEIRHSQDVRNKQQHYDLVISDVEIADAYRHLTIDELQRVSVRFGDTTHITEQIVALAFLAYKIEQKHNRDISRETVKLDCCG